MSRGQEYMDYSDMEGLLKTPEWRVWVQFVKNRKAYLANKTINQVRAKDFIGAGQTAAIMSDIDRQITYFTQEKINLENKYTNKED